MYGKGSTVISDQFNCKKKRHFLLNISSVLSELSLSVVLDVFSWRHYRPTVKGDLKSQISIRRTKCCLCVKNVSGEERRSRPPRPRWKLWPRANLANLANLANTPFLLAKHILPSSPSLRNMVGGFTARGAAVTLLITRCHHRGSGCQNVSVSPLCVKHQGDNSKSQTFSKRKETNHTFSTLRLK